MHGLNSRRRVLTQLATGFNGCRGTGPRSFKTASYTPPFVEARDLPRCGDSFGTNPAPDEVLLNAIWVCVPIL